MRFKSRANGSTIIKATIRPLLPSLRDYLIAFYPLHCYNRRSRLATQEEYTFLDFWIGKIAFLRIQARLKDNHMRTMTLKVSLLLDYRPAKHLNDISTSTRHG